MNRLNDLISALFRRVAAKKIFLYTLAVFLIILPVSIAVLATSSTGNAKTSESTITVTLKDTDGKILATESASSRELGGESLASIIHNLNEGKSRVETLPTFEEAVKPLVIIIDTENDHTELLCYFSLEGRTSFCMDEQGDLYIFGSLDTTDFLTSKYAETLYSNAAQPVLKTIDDETVLPISFDWHYKNVLGIFEESAQTTLGSTSDEYSITGQIDVDFSIPPSYAKATVYGADESKIFTGSIDDLQNLILYASDSVRVVIDAIWQKTSDSTYHGSAHYDFNVTIADRSEFSASSDTLSENGFVILEATNIEDLSKIKFTSEQSYLKPEFIFTGSKSAKAILLYPTDISPDEESFVFSISYRASIERFTLKLNKADHTEQYYAQIDRPSSAVDLNNRLQNEMRSLLGRSSNGSSVKYNAYNAEFLSLSEIGFEKNINFGARVIYPNSDAPTFTSKGCQFISESYGASIPALNAGTVILASKSSLLGNFVVIDHGLGLRVWYCGLSDIDLKENDIVTKGQSVGKTDRDALSGNEGFWIYVTFKNDILDPNAIIK